MVATTLVTGEILLCIALAKHLKFGKPYWYPDHSWVFHFRTMELTHRDFRHFMLMPFLNHLAIVFIPSLERSFLNMGVFYLLPLIDHWCHVYHACWKGNYSLFENSALILFVSLDGHYPFCCHFLWFYLQPKRLSRLV